MIEKHIKSMTMGQAIRITWWSHFNTAKYEKLEQKLNEGMFFQVAYNEAKK